MTAACNRLLNPSGNQTAGVPWAFLTSPKDALRQSYSSLRNAFSLRSTKAA